MLTVHIPLFVSKMLTFKKYKLLRYDGYNRKMDTSCSYLPFVSKMSTLSFLYMMGVLRTGKWILAVRISLFVSKMLAFVRR